MELNKAWDESFEKRTIKQFMRVSKLHKEAFSRFANDFGIHRSQHRILMFVCRKGGYVSQKQIAEAMDVSPAAITVMLNKLEESGYITRTTSSSDSRVNYISPTEKAVCLVKESHRYFESIDRTTLKGIDTETLERLSVALEIMQNNLGEILNKG